jgi:hypothetical protein
MAEERIVPLSHAFCYLRVITSPVIDTVPIRER